MATLPARTSAAPTTRSVEFCISDPSLYERTAQRAYELYLQRGEAHGYDVEDWLEAERQIVAQVPVPTDVSAKPMRVRATTTPTQLLPRPKISP